MPLVVENTLTGEKEPFEPVEEGKVRLYVCGLTPYTDIHAGHARTYIAFDLLRRWLEHEGHDVIHVQNITDVEDKIINAAMDEGISPILMAKQEHKKAEALFDELRLLPAHHWPKVSDHIDHIIRFNEAIQENGLAYEAEGNLYFDVAAFEGYGELSNIDADQLLEETRKKAAAGKRDPRDFALWKTSKEGEPSWESPWGPGRPGWHIECSVMSTQILGPQIDIHGGGRDLQFPHHENEIAQSEAGTGCKPFSKYWMHTGFVTVKGEKMSKSLGNFVTVQDVLEEHRPEAVRLLVASTHYRSPIDFSWDALEKAERTLDGLMVPLHRTREATSLRKGEETEDDESILGAIAATEEEFHDAMDDDLNTPQALARVHELVSALNQYLDHGPPHEAAAASIEAFYDLLDEILAIVPPAKGATGIEDQLLDLLLEVREDARQAKAWDLADKVRDELASLDVVVEDTEEGPRWRRT
ncbi:MAG: cysteine--tRNA ligase [Candidatus Thermoplasmatota archaeon]|nr:cysteine--tRNA ligase [Candidatus Thermoplasmatota archaeon]